jgi:hypothetical protein
VQLGGGAGTTWTIEGVIDAALGAVAYARGEATGPGDSNSSGWNAVAEVVRKAGNILVTVGTVLRCTSMFCAALGIELARFGLVLALPSLSSAGVAMADEVDTVREDEAEDEAADKDAPWAELVHDPYDDAPVDEDGVIHPAATYLEDGGTAQEFGYVGETEAGEEVAWEDHDAYAFSRFVQDELVDEKAAQLRARMTGREEWGDGRLSPYRDVEEWSTGGIDREAVEQADFFQAGGKWKDEYDA